MDFPEVALGTEGYLSSATNQIAVHFANDVASGIGLAALRPDGRPVNREIRGHREVPRAEAHHGV